MTIKFKSKQLGEATPDEVRAYATQFLGISPDGNDKEILAKVRAAIEGDTIFVVDKPDDQTDQTGSPPPNVDGTQQVASGGLVGGLGHGDPKVQITIHAEERDGVVDTRHKAVGVNGVVWLLARGQSITIPYRVFEALNNAERENITHDQQGEAIFQKTKSTPFNVEVMPPQAEIDAWHKRTDAVALP